MVTAQLDQNEIKIYSFSLVGDIAMHCPALLAPNSGDYIQLALNHCNILPQRIDPGMFTQQICINALYMLSNFLVSFQAEFEPFIPALAEKLNKIFEVPKIS